MRFDRRTPVVAVTWALLAAMPLWASSLVSAGKQARVAHSRLSVRPEIDWNRLDGPPGKNVEVWTLDGRDLNEVSFFAGVADGKSLLGGGKKSLLPKVSTTMLMTDIPALLEATYRTLSIVNQMDIVEQAPATLAGHKAIRFTYTLTRADEQIRRKGEAIGAVIDGQLYLVTFEAPALHFFDKDVDKYRQLVASSSF